MSTTMEPSEPPQQSMPLPSKMDKINANATLPTPVITSPPSAVETVYEFGLQLDSPSHVVSERVQTLASQIYTELQRIIIRCGDDEEAVGGLMPLVVNVLESLDLALIENQQFQVELELCKDDNEQLVVAFEKEKTNKKKVEQKLFEFEFTTEEERQQFQQKVDTLANIVKMLELKAKNSSDHASRLEEKESELKKEYNKLHERYTEVLRSHCDLMERVKILIGNDEGLASLNNTNTNVVNYNKFTKRNELEMSNEEMDVPIINEPSYSLHARQAWVDTDLSLEDASIIEDIEEIPRDRDRDRERDRDNHSLTDLEYSNYANVFSSHALLPLSHNEVTDNFFGMEKEVENLIMENNELLATKNALNIVKDDLIVKVDELQNEITMCREEIQQRDAVKDRLKSRISQLEEELKKSKEEFEEAKQKIALQKEDDEEGIPMAQRKRFTRVEMARVLMERNQYKEKLIELQEAIRWTELIRASKNEGEKKSAIWKFFSNLFSSSTSQSKDLSNPNKPSGTAAVRYSTNNPSSVTPALDAMRKRARVHHSGNGNDLLLLLDSDVSSDRARALRNVRAHVNRTGNGDRIQAYGWSIAGGASNTGSGPQPVSSILTGGVKGTSVPVPIYCRPLSGDDVGMKIWCAAAVDLSGGEAGFPNGGKTGGDALNNKMVSQESQIKLKESANKDGFDNALADLETELSQAMNEQCVSSNDSQLSTFVWICSVSHSRSKVTIVNIRSNPGEVLDSLLVKTHLLCIASIPGAKVNDIQGMAGIDEKQNEIILIKSDLSRRESTASESDTPIKTAKSNENVAAEQQNVSQNLYQSPIDDSSANPTLEKLSEFVAYTEPPSPGNCDENPVSASGIYQPMSTCLPTMWLGGQNGVLYVYSSIAQWSHCIAKVKLSDSILQIIHYRGRVFAALANGQLICFVRSPNTGEWDFSQYFVVDIGFNANSGTIGSNESSPKSSNISISSVTNTPNTTALYSIRCIELSKGMIWLGYRNLIFIVDSKTLRIVHSFPVHPRKETQVRQLAVLGDGVWCSLRLDSTLKLYSSIKPYQHLQDVDIEPYVSKMLSPKAFTFIRITALKGSSSRLWIGTANGVILSIPCGVRDETSTQNTTIVSANESGRLSMSTFVPICNLTTAQLSFHGHKDAVKFFVCTKNLVLSGGEGYIDFRLNGDDDATPSLSKGDRSHLIVWEITN